MSASAELQKAIVAALRADAAVSAIVGARVFDRMPRAGEYPCVTYGPSDERDESVPCVTLSDHAVQIDCWSQDAGRKEPCKRLVAAVKAALNEADLSLGDDHALVFIRVRRTRIMDDPDQVTVHGIVEIEAVVEEL